MGEMKLYRNLMSMGGGVEACLERNLVTSALVLIYTGIDTAGWLDSNERFAKRGSFIGWVDKYLLQAKPLACTAIDLYAARCGMVHIFTPDSELSVQGRARRICYAWGSARVENVQRTIDVANKGAEYVAVSVNELYEAWRLGILAFTEEVENDPVRKARVYAKASQFFTELDTAVITDLLDAIDDKESRNATE